MRRIASLVPWSFCLASLLCAQVETNDLRGSLRSNGRDPVSGTPFIVGAVGGSVDLEVGGTPFVPYALALGQLLPNGIALPNLSNEVLNLDLSQPFFIVLDGFSPPGPIGLPPVFYQLDAIGQANIAFPTNPLVSGANYSFQALVLDPTLPIPSLNLTAALEFSIPQTTILDLIPLMTPTLPGVPAADEGLYTHTLSGSYLFYGQAASQVTVSTNGWLKFGTAPLDADPTPAAADLLGGTIGGATAGAGAIVAPLWDDLVFTSNDGVSLIEDPGSGTLIVEWRNGLVGSTPFGTFRAIFDLYVPGAPAQSFVGTNSSGGSVIVSGYRGALNLDYGFFQVGAGTSLVGISDGSAGPGPVVEADLVTAGLVNSYFPPSGASGLSYYQDFSGAGSIPGGLEDLQGLAINFLDLDSNAGGRYIIF